MTVYSKKDLDSIRESFIAKRFYNFNCTVRLPLKSGGSTTLDFSERPVKNNQNADKTPYHYTMIEFAKKGEFIDPQAEEEVDKMLRLSENLEENFSLITMQEAKHISIVRNGNQYPHFIIDQVGKQLLETQQNGVVGKILVNDKYYDILASDHPDHFFLGEQPIELMVEKGTNNIFVLYYLQDGEEVCVLPLLSHEGNNMSLSEDSVQKIHEFKKSIIVEPRIENEVRIT